MAQITVGSTAPIPIPVQAGFRAVIQNIGPGVVFFSTAANVTTATGIQIGVNGLYEHQQFPMNLRTIYLVSASTSDIRYDFL